MNIVITGGAAGLGEAITRRLGSDAGNAVHFTYCQSREAGDALTRAMPNCHGVRCDFSDLASVEALAGKLAEWDVEVLINNAYAGSFIRDHFHRSAPEDFEAEFRRNLLPTVRITQAAIMHFRARKRGRIITILTAALAGVPPMGAAIYVANKAYLAQLTRVWAAENARFNITSNAVSPAFMATRFTAGIDDRVVEQIAATQPLRRLLEPAEVAEAVAFLCIAPTQLNGHTLVLDAGGSLR